MGSDQGETSTNDQEGFSETMFVTAPDDLESVHAEAVGTIERAVRDAGAEGAVVAMSGGIDSTLTAALSREALGEERVLGLGLPSTKTEAADGADARTIAEGLGIEYREIQLRPLVDAFERTVGAAVDPDTEGDHGDDRLLGNATARFRMTAAYYAANATNRLVVGTANRSELLLGYFTKYGDGGVDLNPLGDLYKTEVRALSAWMGLPKRIVGKDPTAGFWAGQTDADELGGTYDEIDPLLRRTIDRGEPVESAAAAVGIETDLAREIVAMCVESSHKRATPPTPGIADRRLEAPPSAIEDA
ncbi:NAD+ synthase [Saliphagus sp. LR7]|uniref:NAD+ synthase n=1 Tax=Saliphagus sp. LR7 TaxID=2282654 RepID=UPI000DF79856|nr:NAD+ synthase [Saliphagus sp. LR7]